MTVVDDLAARSGDGMVAGLTAEAAGAARAWPDEVVRDDPGAERPTADYATRFVSAVAHALADDLAPLTTLCGLDEAQAGAFAVTGRLDTTLRHLDALRRVATRRSALRAGVTPDALEAAFATVARQAAVQACATLAARTVAADTRVSSGSNSMAVTMHELRRPLTVLSSYSQLLARGALGDLNERGEAAAGMMVSAGEVMLRLIEAVGAVARLEDPTEEVLAEAVTVDEVVRAAIADTETEAQLQGVAIGVESEAVVVWGDRERLVLAVTNLLSNAVKHSPPGASVEVRAFRSGPTARVVVRDHGPGLPAGGPARLFEKYVRDAGEAEHGIPGTGLGLFIVATVADRHGGSVEARTAEGGGAEFELTIPALPGPTLAAR